MENIVNARLTKDLGFFLMTYKLQSHVRIVSVIASVIHNKPHALVNQPSIPHSLMKRRNTYQELSSQVQTRWIPEKNSRLLSHVLIVGIWWPWNKTHTPFTLNRKKTTTLKSFFDVAFAAFAHRSQSWVFIGSSSHPLGWKNNTRVDRLILALTSSIIAPVRTMNVVD